jgi:hypothetical protein
MATTRVHDDTLDMHHSGLERLEGPDDTPHGCMNGFVYIGHMIEDEDGGEVEIVEAIPCRRCADSRGG